MNWWRVASILLSVVLSLSLVSSPSARSVVPLHAVEFLSIEAEVISGDDGLVRVSIQLYANVDAQLNLSVDFSGPVDFASTANPKTILSMLSGETEFRTFDLIADQEKPSRAFFVLEAIDPPAGFLAFAQRFVTIVPRDGHTVVFCSDDPSTGQAVEIFPVQGPLKGQDGERIHHNVSITGHFKYLGGDGVPGHYGVYGAGCRLSFYNPSTGWWWHPLLGNIRHTHYDIIAEDGSFFFDFEFDANLGNYNEIWIQVSCVNNATIMPAPDDGYMVWHDGGYTPYLGDNDAIIIRNIDVTSPDLSYHVDNLQMRQDYSSVLRNLMLSREFVSTIYSGSLPFSLPCIPSRVASLPGGVGGSFISCGGNPPRIEISTNYVTLPWIPDHEYGHYVHFCAWGQDCSSAWSHNINQGRILKEGWAMFYGTAVRGYAKRTYGNEHLWDVSWSDQTVPTPFRNPRYSGMGYQFAGHPDFCAFACYLAAIFDGYEDTGFEAPPYLGGDNDDISGQHLRVFESLRTMDRWPVELQPTWYHVKFKDGLPADVQVSADRVVDFMFADLDQVPANAAMRPAQIYQLEAIVPHSGRVELHWSVHAFPSPSIYRNVADGYRVYKEAGGWLMLADLPGHHIMEYVHEEDNVWGLYKVTAYSNISGESCLPEHMSISLTAVPVPGIGLEAYRISGVYPNPFNPTTTIAFYLAESSDVRIDLFSVDGRLIRTLFAGWKDSGDHKVCWDGRDESGREVSSGQYFCQLTAGGIRDARKLVLVK